MHVFRIALASLVTVVWLADYGLAFYTTADNHEGLTALMAIVLGWALGGTAFDTVAKKIRDAASAEDPPDKGRG